MPKWGEKNGLRAGARSGTTLKKRGKFRLVEEKKKNTPEHDKY